MKQLTIILFADALEHKQYVNFVCDKFSKVSDKSEFLGTWCIKDNQEEVYASISMAANHFIENTDKTEIIFGISSKDYEDIISKIHTDNCAIEAINCKNL